MDAAECPGPERGRKVRHVRALIDRHFAGRINVQQECALREHMPDCPSCKEYYERHLLLAEADPQSLASEVRMAHGLGLAELAPASRRPIWLGAMAAAAAAAIAIVVLLPLQHRGPGFAARGGDDVETGLELLVYQLDPEQPARLASREIAASDELAFAYRNEHGKKWLLVFGIDEQKNVYWYHPAWKDPSAVPGAVAIHTAASVPVELPEAIHHDLHGRLLHVHGLFCETRLSVRDVERLVQDLTDPSQPLRLEGALDRVLSLRVKRSTKP